ncbi:MAG: 3-keto-5-aminohexanoate cleavage protein [Candidatus Binataceae bacterium]|jgi:uncharacterized protein (DUF849 family)
MYFTSDSLLPENQEPLIITVAPYGPQWLPSDYPEDIPVTWEQQTQKAVDCFNAGAAVLHFHVRDPKTGHGSKNFNEFNEQIARLRKAVPKMIIQVGGSISFAPADDHEKAHWLGYDTRHMLTELNPKPDQVTIVVGSTQMNILDLTTPDDVQGTQLANPAMQAAYQNMVADATPEFYVEHLKRLRKNGVQPMFAMAHVHTLEAIEHLIRTGVYMGPLNHTMTAIGGAGGCGRNPFDFMEWVRRSPHGSVATYESLWRTVAPYAAMAVALGIHIRVGLEDNMWRRKGERMTSVQQVEQVVRIAKELGRKVATADEARQILKIGTWYNSPDETLANLGLPPNRKDGQLGFIVKETDGRLHPPVSGSDGHPIAGQFAAK